MQTNVSVWSRYQPGFVDPMVAPYVREKTLDRWGNEVKINTWEKQGCKGMVEPALVRVNKGLTFQRMFDSDPCPSGFEKSKEEPSYCVRVTPKHEQVFYSDDAFIPKNQYWNGYADSEGIRNSGVDAHRPSNSFDMRTVHPLTGKYTIYYESKPSAPQRYGRPITNTRKQYDQSWYLKPTGSHAILNTTDSYLG